VSETGDALLSEMNITGFDITGITTADLCSGTEEEDVRRLSTSEGSEAYRRIRRQIIVE
jgi:hypothetical protein